jgi:hypothetical protein
MTQIKPCNCIVCAKEFDPSELHSVASSKINVTRFKICRACLDQCDPAEEYRQAREIINSYLWFAAAKDLFKEASSIVDDVISQKKQL